MAELLGKSAAVKLSSTTIGRMRSFSLTVNGEVVDITEFGDNWIGNKHTVGNWSATAEGMMDLDEASQSTLRAAALAGTQLTTLRFYVDSDNYYSGNCYISSWVANAEAKGLVNFTLSVVGDGELSYT